MLRCAVLCCVVLCTLFFLCCAVLCCVVLCCVMLRCAVLCCAPEPANMKRVRGGSCSVMKYIRWPSMSFDILHKNLNDQLWNEPLAYCISRQASLNIIKKNTPKEIPRGGIEFGSLYQEVPKQTLSDKNDIQNKHWNPKRLCHTPAYWHVCALMYLCVCASVWCINKECTKHEVLMFTVYVYIHMYA